MTTANFLRPSAARVIRVRRRRTAAALMLLVLAIGFSGLYFRSALLTPRRAVLVTLSANYHAPWDVNPWTAENADFLRFLDGHNLSVVDAGIQQEFSLGDWNEVNESIQPLLSTAQTPLLVYINLHSGIDDQERPCLIPPHASPTDSRTWIPFWDFVGRVRQTVGSHRAVVMLLETNRIGAHSYLPLGDESLAAAIERTTPEQFTGQAAAPLHILAATRSRLSTHSDLHQGCDVFTQQLARGLSGEADADGRFGNQDSYVDFDELARFVRHEVLNWSQIHRGVPQNSWSWSNRAETSSIAWSLNLRPQVATTQPVDLDLANATAANWNELARLHTQRPWIAHPGRWKSLVSKALEFEQAVFGGRDVRSQAKAIGSQFSLQVEALERKHRDFTEAANAARQTALEHSNAWQLVAEEPTLAAVLAVPRPLADDAPKSSPLSIPILSLLSQRPQHDLWSDEDWLQRYAELRHQAAEVAATNASRALEPAQQAVWNDLLNLQLSIDDRLLAEVPLADLEMLLDQLDADLNEFAAVNRQIHEQESTRDLVLSEIADVAGSLLASTYPTPSEYLDAEERINLLSLSTATLSDALAAAHTVADVAETRSLLPAWQELQQLTTERWNHLTRLPTLSPTERYALNRLCDFSYFAGEHTGAPVPGETRVAARRRLAKADGQSQQMSSAAEAIQTATASTESQGARDEDSYHELHRISDAQGFFAACLSGETRQRSLSSTEIRELSRLADQVSSLDFDSLSVERLSAILLSEAMQGRLVAGIIGKSGGIDETVRRQQIYLQQQRLIQFASESQHEFWAVPKIDGSNYFDGLARIALEQAEELAIFFESNHGASSTAAATEPLAGSAPIRNLRLVNTELRPALAGGNTQPQDGSSLAYSQDQLLQHRQAAVRAFSATAQWLPEFELVAPQEHLTPTSQITIFARPESRYVPPGLATAVIRSQSDSSLVPINLPLSAPETPVSVQVPWANRALESSDVTFTNAALEFRGHRFDYPFDLEPLRGPAIRSQVAPAQPPQLTIHDANQVARRRTFILDCSASMFSPADRESASATKSTFTKLDAAKQALVAMLRSLRNSGDEISVILYGHRVADSSGSQAKLLQTKYRSKFPFASSLTAAGDVETVLPLGRFGAEECIAVEERLAQTLPWGQTPLYLALAEALKSGQVSNEATQHDIVLISDGRNYQFNPTPEQSVTPEQVIASALERSASIHVVGFGVPDQEAVEAQSQYEQIAMGTGGSATMEIAEASALAERLRQLNAPTRYQVQTDSGVVLQAETGNGVELPLPQQPNAPVAITYAQQTYFVPINSGDALELFTTPRGNLICTSYQTGSPQFVAIVDAQNQPTNLRLGIHQPRRSGREIDWQFSIQTTNGTVVERPRWLLVEIQPQAATAQAAAFPTLRYLVQYWSNGFAVPVANFTSSDWPDDATSASINALVVTHELADRVLGDEDATAAVHAEQEFGAANHSASGTEFQYRRSPSQLSMIVVGNARTQADQWFPITSAINVTEQLSRSSQQQNASYHRLQLAQDNAREYNDRAAKRISELRLEPTALAPLAPKSADTTSGQLIGVATQLTLSPNSGAEQAGQSDQGSVSGANPGRTSELTSERSMRVQFVSADAIRKTALRTGQKAVVHFVEPVTTRTATRMQTDFSNGPVLRAPIH